MKYLAASAAKYCKKGAVNKSAASAASQDSVKFQAVIKPAASAATARLADDGLGALPWVLVSLIWPLGRLR